MARKKMGIEAKKAAPVRTVDPFTDWTDDDWARHNLEEAGGDPDLAALVADIKKAGVWFQRNGEMIELVQDDDSPIPDDLVARLVHNREGFKSWYLSTYHAPREGAVGA